MKTPRSLARIAPALLLLALFIGGLSIRAQDATTKMTLGLTAKNTTKRSDYTSETNYWVGSMGWGGTYDWNSIFWQGNGFFDNWGTDLPGAPEAGYVHAQGIQVEHFNNGSTGYGWQMMGGNAGNGNWYLRTIWGGGFNPWYKIIHSGNISAYALPSSGGTVNGSLSVKGTYNTPLIQSNYADSQTAGIGVDANGTYWGIGLFQNGTKLLNVDSNGALLVGSSYVAGDGPANGLAVQGNVGIGTATPNASVDIWKHYSAGTDSLRFSFNDGSAYWMGIQTYVAGPANVGYRFRTNNVNTTVDALAIAGDGKIGMGTLNPVEKLDIVGSAQISQGGYLKFPHSQQSDVNDGRIGAGLFGTGLNVVGINTNGTYRKFSIYGEITQHQNNGTNTWSGINYFGGNVGIGTSSPTHKLAVNGTIRAKEIIVDNTGWADYVFEESYNLTPLSDVEAHIKAKKHLPGIPSAAEIAEHGVSMGDMQSKLLSKIEELTLHMIKQEKLMTAQQSEIATLRQQVSELKAATQP